VAFSRDAINPSLGAWPQPSGLRDTREKATPYPPKILVEIGSNQKKFTP
jgi:hypothetical protein